MIHPVNALTPKVFFKGDHGDSQEFDKSKVERNIAIINAAGISTAVGAAMMAVSRSYTSNWKHAGLIGLASAFLSMLFVAPSFLYKAGIYSQVKSGDKDFFIKKKGLSAKVEAYSKNLVKKAV